MICRNLISIRIIWLTRCDHFIRGLARKCRPEQRWTSTSVIITGNVAVSMWSIIESHLLCIKIGPNHGKPLSNKGVRARVLAKCLRRHGLALIHDLRNVRKKSLLHSLDSFRTVLFQVQAARRELCQLMASDLFYSHMSIKNWGLDVH